MKIHFDRTLAFSFEKCPFKTTNGLFDFFSFIFLCHFFNKYSEEIVFDKLSIVIIKDKPAIRGFRTQWYLMLFIP